MLSNIAKILDISVVQQEALENSSLKLKSVAEFLAEIAEKSKEADWLDKLNQICPWVTPACEAAASIAPPIKFLAVLLEKLGEIKDPEKLALLAFTIAYQQSVEKSLKAAGNATGIATTLRPTSIVDDTVIDLLSYSIKDLPNHPFVTASNSILNDTLLVAGYTASESLKIQTEIIFRFPGALNALLSHPETRAKFAPVKEALAQESFDAVWEAWQQHFEYLRYQYEDKKIFGEEPFALADVYAETECGVLKWQEFLASKPSNSAAQESGISGRNRIDPFDLKTGGSVDLLKTVMDLIHDKNFKDTIVIQGPAGSGKSTFTLRLSVELWRSGFNPIRIRFRDIPSHINNILDALPQAVRFWEPEDRIGEMPPVRPEQLFLDKSLFDQAKEIDGCKICPWVLIIDGYDEVSIGVEKGYDQRVKEILEQIRNEFINRIHHPLVRVILTGRPSEAVSSSSFMTEKTYLLTIKPLPPTKLTKFVHKLAGYLAEPGKPALANPSRFNPVVENYAANYNASFSNQKISNSTAMEVMGAPLLAHLAVRLMVCWPDHNLQTLIDNPTTLYRH